MRFFAYAQNDNNLGNRGVIGIIGDVYLFTIFIRRFAFFGRPTRMADTSRNTESAWAEAHPTSYELLDRPFRVMSVLSLYPGRRFALPWAGS